MKKATPPQSSQFLTQNDNTTTTGKRHGLRQAINAKCKQCVFDQIGGTGTWRQQTAACTSKSCPLYNVRPRPTGYMAQSLIALENSELGHNAFVSDAGKVM
jgi:hypothetical protein